MPAASASLAMRATVGPIVRLSIDSGVYSGVPNSILVPMRISGPPRGITRLTLSTYRAAVDSVNRTRCTVRMAPNTREAIIDAAAALLDEGGPAVVTFRAVGARVGLSHNAAFKLFRDKESLLAAVAARELRRQAAALGSAVAPDA